MDSEGNEIRKRRKEDENSRRKKQKVYQDGDPLDMNYEMECEDGECSDEDSDSDIYGGIDSDNLNTDSHEKMYNSNFGVMKSYDVLATEDSLHDGSSAGENNSNINTLLDILYNSENARTLLESSDAKNQLLLLMQKSLKEKQQKINSYNENSEFSVVEGMDDLVSGQVDNHVTLHGGKHQNSRISTSALSYSSHQHLEVSSENKIFIPIGTTTSVNLCWRINPASHVVITKQNDDKYIVFKACGKSAEIHSWYKNRLVFSGDTNEGLINFTLTNVHFLDQGTYIATDHLGTVFIGPTIVIETQVKENDTAHIYWVLTNILHDSDVEVYRQNGPLLFKAFGQNACVTDAYRGRVEFSGDTKIGLISFRLLHCLPHDQGLYKASYGGRQCDGRHLHVQGEDLLSNVRDGILTGKPSVENKSQLTTGEMERYQDRERNETITETSQTTAGRNDAEKEKDLNKQNERKVYDKHEIKEVQREAGLTVFMIWKMKPVSESVKVTIRKKMGPTVLVANGKIAKIYPAYANRASFLGDTTQGLIKLTIEKLKVEDYGTYVAVGEDDGQEFEGPKLVILTRLYVGNLPNKTKVLKVKNFFESNGVSVTTVKNEKDCFSAYTFVRCDAYDVDKALALDGLEFRPNTNVKIAIAKSPKKQENDEEENDGILETNVNEYERIRDEYGKQFDEYGRPREEYRWHFDDDRWRDEHESRRDEYERWRRHDEFDRRVDSYYRQQDDDWWRDDIVSRRQYDFERRRDDSDSRQDPYDRYRDDDDRRRDDYDWRKGDYYRRRYEDERRWEEYEREKKKKELVYLGNLPSSTSTFAVKNFFKTRGYDVVPHFLDQQDIKESNKISCLLKCDPDHIKRILEFDGELFFGTVPIEVRPPKDEEIKKSDTEMGNLYKDMTPGTDTKKFKLEALTDLNSVTLFVGNLKKYTKVSEIKNFFEEEDIKVEVLEEGHSIYNKHTHIKCHKRDIYKALALNGLNWHRLPIEIYKVDSLKSSADALKAKSENQNKKDDLSQSGETNQAKGDKSEENKLQSREITIIVGNLPNSYPTTYLNDLFDNKKIPVKVINRRTMSPNAYVDLEKSSDLPKALKLNGEPVDWFNKIHKIKVKQKPNEDAGASQGQSSQNEKVGVIVGNLPVPYPLAVLKEFFHNRQINTLNIETKINSPYAYVVLGYGDDLKNALLLNGESLNWENKEYNITVEKSDKPSLEEFLSHRIQPSSKKETNKMAGSSSEELEKTIWVGNLSTKVYPSEVKKFFHDQGIPVSRVWKVDTERYALVDLVDPSQIRHALSLQGERLAKHRLKIRLGSDPKAKRSSRHNDDPEKSQGSSSQDYDSHHHSYGSRKLDSYPYQQ